MGGLTGETTEETFVCDPNDPDPDDYLIREGYSDTGPWLVVCNPL